MAGRSEPIPPALIEAADLYQSYFPDHARDERHPEPGIDPTHRHFAEYLRAHGAEQ